MIFCQEVGYCHNKTRKVVQWPEYCSLWFY